MSITRRGMRRSERKRDPMDIRREKESKKIVKME